MELYTKEFVLELNTKKLGKLYQLSNHYSYDCPLNGLENTEF
jgi:hypothetical protein